MKRTISIAKGKGSIGHNNRDFKADNIDSDRIKFNTCYVNEDLKEVYKNLFGESLIEYNAKQKRKDRKISDYYEKIRTSKQEKLFYEIIVQVGNFENMNAITENGKLAEKILNQYMEDFQARNPMLYVYSAHLHMDEATPHLHIDFVPYTKGNKRGLETKNTLKGALNQLGFLGGAKSSTELNQFQNSEKEVVAEIMLEYGIEWEKKGTHNEQLPVLDYKKQQRALEVEKLDKIIEAKTEIAAELDLKNEEVVNAITEKSDKLKKVEIKLNSMLKDAKTIDNNIYKFDENPEWQLEEPSLMMTANSYKQKKAEPLVNALKEYIRGLTLKFVKLKSAFDNQQKTISNLNNRLDTAYMKAEKHEYGNSRYNLLEKIMGKDKIDRMIDLHERNHREEIANKKKISTKTKDNER